MAPTPRPTGSSADLSDHMVHIMMAVVESKAVTGTAPVTVVIKPRKGGSCAGTR